MRSWFAVAAPHAGMVTVSCVRSSIVRRLFLTEANPYPFQRRTRQQRMHDPLYLRSLWSAPGPAEEAETTCRSIDTFALCTAGPKRNPARTGPTDPGSDKGGYDDCRL